MSFLFSDIEFLKGVGPVKGEALRNELGVKTPMDLLEIYPFRYVDKTRFQKIKDLKPNGDIALIKAQLISLEKIKGKTNRQRLSGLVKDESGLLELVWFQKIKIIEEILVPGKEYIIYGRTNTYGGKASIAHPEIEEYQQDIAMHQTLDPVYSSTEKLDGLGLDSKGRRRLIKAILEKISERDIGENLPDELLTTLKLPSRYQSMVWAHFPSNENEKNLSHNRIKFEEFFFLQVQMLYTKATRKQNLKGLTFGTVGEIFNQFYGKYLPFELTGAQKRVIREIRTDMGGGKQMNRLLQGDVGSGKTIVALLCMLLAIDNGFQSCLVAPTEILAQQHYTTITGLVKDLPVKVAFLSGSVKGKQRREVLEQLESGEIHILIGTHAVFEEKVVFAALGLSITDEQHRFGVAQRAKMWMKTDALPPHILVMTATPIPRTLAMTMYGDLDVSVIDELPPGRKDIITVHRYESHRMQVIGFMKEQIAAGHQIYVVYPLIEESEALDLKDLQQGYERLLQYFPRPVYQISVVHGRMKQAEKDFEMDRFIKKITHIMVATTVIEVGVNVPNATTMIIENCERFGLSQLHQLRGRVGRGAQQSYCLLMSGDKLSHDARKRIKTMCETNNGFVIAEVDLELRGPGEIDGTRQSGVTSFKMLNLIKDQKIMVAARNIAQQVLDEDPELLHPKNIRIRNYLKSIQKPGSNWALIS
ncbi:MAG: ATP-dependent DNA helicase RecG [Saprospiraceae bacterium]|nr:ATP-dependent DNA helicase RecG [Saprospiraceae bacterium]